MSSLGCLRKSKRPVKRFVKSGNSGNFISGNSGKVISGNLISPKPSAKGNLISGNLKPPIAPVISFLKINKTTAKPPRITNAGLLKIPPKN